MPCHKASAVQNYIHMLRITCAPYAAPIFFFLCGECGDPSPPEIFALSLLLSAAAASASARRRERCLTAAAAAHTIGNRTKGGT